MVRKLPLFAVSLLLFACLVIPAAAQSMTTGDIAGVVTDPSGAVLPNVPVTLRNNSTGLTQSTNTNASGTYRFTLLQPGSYTVNVSQQGFNATKQTVTVALGQVQTANIQLQVGTASQTVEVTAAAPVPEPTSLGAILLGGGLLLRRRRRA